MGLLDELIPLAGSDIRVRKVLTFFRGTAVLSAGCGLAYNFWPRSLAARHQPVRDCGQLTQKSARELASYLRSEHTLEAAIGLAAVNSCIRLERNRCVEQNAFELVAARAAGQRVAVVGHFPAVERLYGIAREVFVLEQEPETGDLPTGAAAEVIPRADIVMLTASTIINHTIEQLLELAKGKFTVILGPSTPLTTLLFDYGADALCGVEVVDEERVLRELGEGASFRSLGGVRRLTLLR